MKQYAQNLAGCLTGTIGETGLSNSQMQESRDRTLVGTERIRKAYTEREWPVLLLPEERGDLESLKSIGQLLNNQSDTVVVLGMGGSSLGGQTLVRLASHDNTTVEFMENLDGHTFARRLSGLNLRRTSIVSISKSGRTPETAMQTLAFLNAYRSQGLQDEIPARFLFITAPGDNPLRNIATHLNAPVLDHDPDLGGRYSVLSSVGLLPAIIAGLDGAAVRAGAQSVLIDVLENDENEPARGAATICALAEAGGRTTSVFMPYADKGADLARWYVQLAAESLGKDGKGLTPISALGPQDQHSAAQLFLAGPDDKVFTIVSEKRPHDGPEIFGDIIDENLAHLEGRTLGQLVAAETSAMITTLGQNHRPVRVFEVDVLDEMSMGALMMHFMLETIILGDMLGVNPFDQPSVEAGKILAAKYLHEL